MDLCVNGEASEIGRREDNKPHSASERPLAEVVNRRREAAKQPWQSSDKRSYVKRGPNRRELYA